MKQQSACQKNTETSHASSPISGMLIRKFGEVFSLVCVHSVIQISQLQFIMASSNLLLCENMHCLSAQNSDIYKQERQYELIVSYQLCCLCHIWRSIDIILLCMLRIDIAVGVDLATVNKPQPTYTWCRFAFY